MADQERRIISAKEFAEGWDSERSVHELKDLSVSLKGTMLYIPVKTKAEMDAVYGAPTTTVKFRTFEDFRVWLTPCKPTEADARQLSPTSDTLSAGQLAFAIPLRKLGITVPENRQYTFMVEEVPVEGGGAVFEISFRNFMDQPRNVDTELKAAVKKAKAEQAKAKRDQKRAERLAKLNGGGAAGTGTSTDKP